MTDGNQTFTDSPKTPRHSTTRFSNLQSPISSKQKQTFFTNLKKVDINQIKEVLIAAAINLCKFPEPLHSELESLQKSLLQHKDREKVITNLKRAIEGYITEDGYLQFQELLQKDFIEISWNSNFVCFLSKHLNLELQSEPLIEVAIQNGKIYWRIIKDNEEIDEIYNRPKAKGLNFDFSTADCIRLTLEQFQALKNSGKRSGTVAITQKRFVEYFEPKYQDQAAAVWQELKDKGILNAKNKFSDGWRIISHETIALHSLIMPVYIISRDDVKDCLKELRGTKKNQVITKKIFIDYWENQYQRRAGLIWDKLKAINIIDANNKVPTLENFSLAEFLNSLHLDYANVIKALYEIANNNQFQERLDELPEFSKFRFERSFKTWENTGHITNAIPDEEKYCTKQWDVGTYDDLDKHRNTSYEVKNNGSKLNYDHIPSSDVLKKSLPDLEKELDMLKTECLIKRNKLIEEKDERKLLMYRDLLHATRQQTQHIDDQELKKIETKIQNCQKEHDLLILKLDFIKTEEKGHGPYWWTIAILEKLHKQGETFLQSSKDQKKSQEHPFIKDVSAYLDILEERYQEFNLTPEDYIKALSAFRYLYRCQVKSTEPVAGQIRIGSAPQAFFRKPDDLKTIDKLITDRLRYFMAKREGFQLISTVAKQLIF